MDGIKSDGHFGSGKQLSFSEVVSQGEAIVANQNVSSFIKRKQEGVWHFVGQNLAKPQGKARLRRWILHRKNYFTYID